MPKAKKDIDKEVMYQKIIPSAMRNGSDVETAMSGLGPVGTVPAAAAPKEPVSPSTKPSAVQPQKTEEQSAVVNIMEKLVEDKIDRAIEKFRCCTCEKCRSDITAIALNKLSPKYVVADPTIMEEACLDPQANAQAATAIVQAILVVKANPKHEL